MIESLIMTDKHVAREIFRAIFAYIFITETAQKAPGALAGAHDSITPLLAAMDNLALHQSSQRWHPAGL